jgi:hypothetical protein
VRAILRQLGGKAVHVIASIARMSAYDAAS